MCRNNINKMAVGMMPLLCTLQATAATAITDHTVMGHAPIVRSVAVDKEKLFVGEEVTTTGIGLEDEDGDKPLTVTYQWRRCGRDIPGATDPSYTISQDDIGCQIAVGVTPTTIAQVTEPAVGDEFIKTIEARVAMGYMSLSDSPEAHSPVTVTLVLGPGQTGKTNLKLTGTGENLPPVFHESSTNGTYTAIFTPIDIKKLTLGVDGLSGFTSTLDIIPAAAVSPKALVAKSKVIDTVGSTPTAIASGGNIDATHTIRYSSDKPDVVEVDPATGQLMLKAGGTATITATVAAHDGYAEQKVSTTVLSADLSGFACSLNTDGIYPLFNCTNKKPIGVPLTTRAMIYKGGWDPYNIGGNSSWGPTEITTSSTSSIQRTSYRVVLEALVDGKRVANIASY